MADLETAACPSSSDLSPGLLLPDPSTIHQAAMAARLLPSNTPCRDRGPEGNEWAETEWLYREGNVTSVTGRRLGADHQTVGALVLASAIAAKSRHAGTQLSHHDLGGTRLGSVGYSIGRSDS